MTTLRRGSFVCRPLEPFGVKVEGVDLTRPLSAEDQAAFKDLLFAHGVLVFENQALSDPDQRRLMGYIGRVANGYNGFSMLAPDGELGNSAIVYHYDYGFTSHPMTALSLFAVDVVEGESCTNFASGVRPYARMPQPLKDRMEGRQARAVMAADHERVQLDEPFPEGMPSYVRDLVIDHPVTGEKVVYVAELQTCGVEGMPEVEGKALVRELYEHIYRPDNVYSHVWKNGDLVVWDNYALQHGRPSLAQVKTRSLRRISVAEKELLELCPELARGEGVVDNLLSHGKIAEATGG